MSMKPYDELP